MITFSDFQRPAHAYILAGGESRRFGTPKSRVSIRGELLINKLIRELLSCGLQPTIVAQQKEDYADIACGCITDRVSRAGPLAGVEAALEDCKNRGASWCWIASCDLISWNPSWMEYALETIRDRSATTMAIIFGDDFLPFPGMYSTQGLPSLLAAWSDGQRSVRAWHERMAGGVIRIPVPMRDQAKTFNTPDELASLLDDMPQD